MESMLHSRAYNIEAFGRLLDTLDRLRVECPWDRKQTFKSLLTNSIEEVYELADALRSEDMPNVKKELGDVLLHVIFYAKIASEQRAFDIGDVADALNAKLIFRHPHVFGSVEASDAHQVEQNWEQIKLKEKGGNRTVLAGVPTSLPAMIKAYRIQEKAANVGFDWSDTDSVWQKVNEEIGEFHDVCTADDDKSRREEEFGDILFSLINVARHYGINPENALEHTNRKFIRRFGHIKESLTASGKKISEATLEEMDRLWNESKSTE